MSYDRFAPFYKLAETLVFGRDLQRARCAGLGDKAPKSVLIVGGGDGRYLEQAIRAWPDADFVSIEASAGMLRQAKKRVADDRVRFIYGDVIAGLREIQSQKFDVIVSHFFLDCFREENLETLVPMLSKKRTQSGVWFVSEFTDQKRHHRAMLWIMYRFFHNFTETPARSLPDYGRIMRAHGLVPETIGSWRSGFLTAQLCR